MTVVTMPEMLAEARRDGYAVGYFESWDLYSLEAVIAAAEAERAPVIIGIGGLTASHPWLRERGIAIYGYAATTIAHAASVPVSVLFNEAESLEECEIALGSGYNAVMMVTGALPWARSVSETAHLVQLARRFGVAVEGECDELAEIRDGELSTEHSRLTDVSRAVEFVEQTGVECLAASVGSVHFVTGGFEPTIRIDLISELAAAVAVPLVLHGGSGVTPDQLAAAVHAGITKVNFATKLKQSFNSGLRSALAGDEADPNVAYGSRLPGDVLTAAATELTGEVRRYMQILGSSGKAVR